MKKLYEVSAKFYAYAENENEAIQPIMRMLQNEILLSRECFAVKECSDIKTVPSDWRDQIPFGDKVNSTIDEILADDMEEVAKLYIT